MMEKQNQFQLKRGIKTSLRESCLANKSSYSHCHVTLSYVVLFETKISQLLKKQIATNKILCAHVIDSRRMVI
jgi:hypothetical protein